MNENLKVLSEDFFLNSLSSSPTSAIMRGYKEYFDQVEELTVETFEKEIKLKKVKKIEKSSLIGEILAKRAKEKNISNVYFDRGEYKYHGRVKIFAETLRKNGLKF